MIQRPASIRCLCALLAVLCAVAVAPAAAESPTRESGDADALIDALLGEILGEEPVAAGEAEGSGDAASGPEAGAADESPPDPETAALAEELLRELLGEEELLRPWDLEVSLEFGGGYRENVLYSSFAPRDSTFLKTGAELLLMKLPLETPSEFFFYGLWEGIRYGRNRVPEAPDEQLVVVQTRWKQPIRGRLSGGLEGKYTFVDQVYDISFSDLDLTTTVLRLHQPEAGGFLEWAFSEELAVTVRGAFNRPFFDNAEEDYGEPRTEAGIRWDSPRFGRLDASVTLQWRRFGRRLRRDLAGNRLENDPPDRWFRPEINLRWKRTWGEHELWTTQTRIRWLRNRDDEEGYYDYDRWRVSQSLTFTWRGWTVDGKVQSTWTDYVNQTNRVDPEEAYARTLVNWEATVERPIGDAWALRYSWRSEDNASNRVDEDYRSATHLLSVRRTF